MVAIYVVRHMNTMYIGKGWGRGGVVGSSSVPIDLWLIYLMKCGRL